MLMEKFTDWSEAFDYCREGNSPVVVEILNEGKFKLFPSGKAIRLTGNSAKNTGKEKR